jgi:hypothetical protein
MNWISFNKGLWQIIIEGNLSYIKLSFRDDLCPCEAAEISLHIFVIASLNEIEVYVGECYV